jgi:hypothetical protein
MNSLICAPATCSPVVGNILVYMDSHHLTQSFTATLSPYLKDKLVPVVKQVVEDGGGKVPAAQGRTRYRQLREENAYAGLALWGPGRRIWRITRVSPD